MYAFVILLCVLDLITYLWGNKMYYIVKYNSDFFLNVSTIKSADTINDVFGENCIKRVPFTEVLHVLALVE